MTAADRKMRLLITEDDRESADYLVKAFREVGHVADHAADGEEGLALAVAAQSRYATGAASLDRADDATWRAAVSREAISETSANDTGRPELAVALSVTLEPAGRAVAGAVKVIVWATFVVVSVTALLVAEPRVLVTTTS